MHRQPCCRHIASTHTCTHTASIHTHRARSPVVRKPTARCTAVACRVRASAIRYSGSSSLAAAVCSSRGSSSNHVAAAQHNATKTEAVHYVHLMLPPPRTDAIQRATQQAAPVRQQHSVVSPNPAVCDCTKPAAPATHVIGPTCAGRTKPAMPGYSTCLALARLANRRHTYAAAAATAAAAIAVGVCTLQALA